MITASACFGVLAGESGLVSEAARLYNQTCVVCHAEGVQGAPMPGVRDDWEAPLSYGKSEMYLNTIEGIGEMPPRGMCGDCSDDQLKAVVDYMLL